MEDERLCMLSNKICLDYYKYFRIGNWEGNYDLIYVGILWYVGKYKKGIGTFDVKNLMEWKWR